MIGPDMIAAPSTRSGRHGGAMDAASVEARNAAPLALAAADRATGPDGTPHRFGREDIRHGAGRMRRSCCHGNRHILSCQLFVRPGRRISKSAEQIPSPSPQANLTFTSVKYCVQKY